MKKTETADLCFSLILLALLASQVHGYCMIIQRWLHPRLCRDSRDEETLSLALFWASCFRKSFCIGQPLQQRADHSGIRVPTGKPFEKRGSTGRKSWGLGLIWVVIGNALLPAYRVTSGAKYSRTSVILSPFLWKVVLSCHNCGLAAKNK